MSYINLKNEKKTKKKKFKMGKKPNKKTQECLNNIRIRFPTYENECYDKRTRILRTMVKTMLSSIPRRRPQMSAHRTREAYVCVRVFMCCVFTYLYFVANSVMKREFCGPFHSPQMHCLISLSSCSSWRCRNLSSFSCKSSIRTFWFWRQIVGYNQLICKARNYRVNLHKLFELNLHAIETNHCANLYKFFQ